MIKGIKVSEYKPCSCCEAKGYVYNELVIKDSYNWSNPRTYKTHFRQCPVCEGRKEEKVSQWLDTSSVTEDIEEFLSWIND